MQNGEFHDQIEDLEAQIESLAEAAESCRKWILVSKLAAAGGGISLLANIAGILPLDLPLTVLAIAAVLGGIVLGGSSSSTLRQITAAIANAEALRAKMKPKNAIPNFIN